MLGLARVFLVLVGVMLVALGLWTVAYGNEGDPGLVIVGILTISFGVVFIGVLAFERMRYRSAATEIPTSVGSPGGEVSGEPLEPRFQPTSEVFIDPSSGKRMRVFADPASGERRYKIDG